MTFLFEFLRTVDAYRYLALGVSMTAIAVLAPQGLVPIVIRLFSSLFGAFGSGYGDEEIVDGAEAASGESREGLAEPSPEMEEPRPGIRS